jgi:hypothetical protein
MFGLLAQGLGGQMRLSGQCDAAIGSLVIQFMFSRSMLDPADRHRTLVEIDRRLQKLESETRAEPDSKAVPDVTLSASVLGSHSFQ